MLIRDIYPVHKEHFYEIFEKTSEFDWLMRPNGTSIFFHKGKWGVLKESLILDLRNAKHK